MDLTDAELARLARRYTEAAAIYERVLARDPGEPRARCGRALCWAFGSGRLADAIAELERLRDEHPDYGWGRLHLYRLYRKMGCLREADAELAWLAAYEPSLHALLAPTLAQGEQPSMEPCAGRSYWSRRSGLELIYQVTGGPYRHVRTSLGAPTQATGVTGLAYPLRLTADGRQLATEWLLSRHGGPAQAGVDRVDASGALLDSTRVHDALPLATRRLPCGGVRRVIVTQTVDRPCGEVESVSLDATLQYHGEERLELPAGTLDCGCFEQILVREDRPRLHLTRWYARDLGLARLVTSTGEDWRLVAVEGASDLPHAR